MRTRYLVRFLFLIKRITTFSVTGIRVVRQRQHFCLIHHLTGYSVPLILSCQAVLLLNNSNTSLNAIKCLKFRDRKKIKTDEGNLPAVGENITQRNGLRHCPPFACQNSFVYEIPSQIWD